MRQIKRFTGTTPPILKEGEFATNGFILCLGTGDGEYKLFQGVLDFEKNQKICGFELVDSTLKIPSGTPFSKLQELFNALPKLAFSQGYNSISLTLEFEDGDYINDTGKWIQVRDIMYSLKFKAKNETSAVDKNVRFDLERSLEFYNCPDIEIESIQIESPDVQGGIYAYGNTTVFINHCTLKATAEVALVTPRNARIILYSSYLKMYSNHNSPIIRNTIFGGRVVIDGCVAEVGEAPKCISVDSYGHIVTVGKADQLNLLQNSQSSIYFDSGLEVMSFNVIE